ncbi:MAG: hypothetical protein C4557_07440 [Anaerolineaceae bacterium]|jgi:hypothetical protein|nr:MAG: hypothetical protein C4557_07440 [Anaerolineaceae bacterium]
MQKFETVFFRYVMTISVLALLSVTLIYVYLGTFSRYIADDYCEAVRVTSASPVQAVLDRYSVGAWRAANRYSNLLFVGVSESLGGNNMPFAIASMSLLWLVGLTWSAREVGKLLKMNWVFETDLFIGLAFGFFSFLQAPSLFQTVYWRSSMMTHFAPLVFGSLLFAFVMRQVRRSEDKPLSLPVSLFILVAAFFIAGFSEPPTTTLLTILPLLMIVVWAFTKSPVGRKKFLAPLAWTFAGVVLGFLAMIFSPALAGVAREKTLNIIDLLATSFYYGYLFIIDTLKTQPLPILVSVLIPLLLIWLHRQMKPSELSQGQKRVIWVIIFAIPFLAWLLIAAGFSPSVYGQGFPVERARFLARSILIAAFMLEGALFGLLSEHIQFKSNKVLGQWVVMVVFALIAIVYPLRAAVNLYKSEVPEYRERAELWDLREDYIIRHAEAGEKDIVIPGFSGVYHVKELDNNPDHWVNLCAAQYYGVDSIRAVSVPDENLLEFLNE